MKDGPAKTSLSLCSWKVCRLVVISKHLFMTLVCLIFSWELIFML